MKIKKDIPYFFGILFKIFFLFFLFYSCKPIKKNNFPLSDPINYHKIDLYPILPECKKIKSSLQKTCFYKAISNRILQTLSNQNLKFNSIIQDSILVYFRVDTQGITSVLQIKHHPTPKNKPYLDSLIINSFQKLPKMKPAIKMGIPVKAEFNIPILVNTKKE